MKSIDQHLIDIGLTKLYGLAKKHQDARTAYEMAFDDYMENLVQPLPVAKFWIMVDQLRDLIYVRVNRGSSMVEHGIDEFYRLAQVGQATYSFEECLQFTVRWNQAYRVLQKPLFDIVTDESDDGYSDLLDSLPFAGREFFNRCRRKQIMSGTFKQELKSATDRWLNKFICGENYIRMRLKDEGRRRFVWMVMEKDRQEA